MIVAGIYKSCVFILNLGDYRGFLDRANHFNLADCFLDGKFVIPILQPGIVRTSEIENIRTLGMGVDVSTKYRFSTILTAEISPDGSLYVYDSFSSSDEKYELNNFIMKRYSGNVKNEPVAVFTSSSQAEAVLVNAHTKAKMENLLDPQAFVSYIIDMVHMDRFAGQYYTLYMLPVNELLHKLKEVNAGDIEPHLAVNDWVVRNNYNEPIHNLAYNELALFTFENVGQWQHYYK